IMDVPPFLDMAFEDASTTPRTGLASASPQAVVPVMNERRFTISILLDIRPAGFLAGPERAAPWRLHSVDERGVRKSTCHRTVRSCCLHPGVRLASRCLAGRDVRRARPYGGSATPHGAGRTPGRRGPRRWRRAPGE